MVEIPSLRQLAISTIVANLDALGIVTHFTCYRSSVMMYAKL
jgi:hypothetical protein